MATEAYTSKLQQHLINNQIYPEVHMYLNRPLLLPPANSGGILRMLSSSRSSLHSSSSSKVDFDAFCQVNSRAANDQEVLNEVVPLIEGNHGPVDECAGYPFRNMSQITNKMLRPVKPDRFYGANGDTLDRTVCEGLSSYIKPAKHESLPIVLPNFTLEAKGPNGSLIKSDRQACHHGALGSRAMHCIQNYRQDTPTYDNNAYTISFNYHSRNGALALYITHPQEFECASGHRQGHVMTIVGHWNLTKDAKTFHEGVSAYRNARDWAKEQRDRFIRQANARVPQTDTSDEMYQAGQDLENTEEEPEVQHNPLSDQQSCFFSMEDVEEPEFQHDSLDGSSSPPPLGESSTLSYSSLEDVEEPDDQDDYWVDGSSSLY